MRTDGDEKKGLNRVMWPLSGENNGTGNYQWKNYQKCLETVIVKSSQGFGSYSSLSSQAMTALLIYDAWAYFLIVIT